MATAQAVLFDNDGTLVNTSQLILESFRYATKKALNKVIPDEVLMAKNGQPLYAQVPDFTSDPNLQEQIIENYRVYNEKHHDGVVKAFDGTVLALKRLHEAGFTMGVVTSKRHELAQRGLDIVGAAPYLNCLVGMDDCPGHKPEPEPVLMGCELLGVRPEQCVYVGDSPYDVQAGKAAGCTAIGVAWGGVFSEEELRAASPHYLCTSYNRLVEILLELHG